MVFVIRAVPGEADIVGIRFDFGGDLVYDRFSLCSRRAETVNVKDRVFRFTGRKTDQSFFGAGASLLLLSLFQFSLIIGIEIGIRYGTRFVFVFREGRVISSRICQDDRDQAETDAL